MDPIRTPRVRVQCRREGARWKTRRVSDFTHEHTPSDREGDGAVAIIKGVVVIA